MGGHVSNYDYTSRRSVVYATRGMVATSQPLAALAGLDMLRLGGSAADAAIAAASMLNVVEPVSTGMGGDAFALYYEAATGQVHALNASGRSGRHASACDLRNGGFERVPSFSGHAVTVPGAVAGWCDLLERFGRLPRRTVLAPAIQCALRGFPVSEVIADSWARSVLKLLRSPDWQSPDPKSLRGPAQPSGDELLLHGRAPGVGERIALPTLAASLKAVADGGTDWFYRGEFAAALCEHVQRYGGWLVPDDLADHRSEWVTPISIDYRGHRAWQCPPNGQGLAMLLALGLARGLELERATTLERAHALIECMRLAFADAFRWVADPDHSKLPIETLLSEAWLAERRRLVPSERALAQVGPAAVAEAGDDTVYVSAVDGEGNACSFINSLYMGTGTGLVVPGSGISLQNRGANFSLEPGHPNELAPGKRPYHTIIPGMVTRDDGSLYACYGVMGGYMQPQGQLQVLMHLLLEGDNEQVAMDRARWQVMVNQGSGTGADEPGGVVALEPALEAQIGAGLRGMGHRTKVLDGFDRLHMGGGQLVTRDAQGVLAGGSDPRKDGCAIGW